MNLVRKIYGLSIENNISLIPRWEKNMLLDEDKNVLHDKEADGTANVQRIHEVVGQQNWFNQMKPSPAEALIAADEWFRRTRFS